ncbi:hypothetical protein JW877_04805 [bacterium]|nr:hypothetical protein [bacterium]
MALLGFVLLLGSTLFGEPAVPSFQIQSNNSELEHNLEKSAASSYRQIIQYFPGLQIGSLITIRIIDSDREFQGSLGGTAPDWGVGIAIPRQTLIIMKSPDLYDYPQKFEEVLTHEMAHLLLHYRLDHSPIPRWFDEGFAQFVSERWSFTKGVTLTTAVWSGKIPSLNDLESLNQFDRIKANLAYTISFSAFSYLFQKIGTDGFAILLNNIASTGDFHRGFQLTTGVTIETFNQYWLSSLKNKYNWSYIINDPRLVYFLFLILLIAAMISKMIRRKKILKQWEEEEKGYFDPHFPQQ